MLGVRGEGLGNLEGKLAGGSQDERGQRHERLQDQQDALHHRVVLDILGLGRESLRKIAALFDDKIQANAEAVIAKYQPLVDGIIAKYKPRLDGKKVMLYVGGLRPRHVATAYDDLGMNIVGTGYEFAHNDDYQRTT